MNRASKIFTSVILTGLMINLSPWFGHLIKAQEREQPPRQNTERPESPEQRERIRNRLAELRENARNAEEQGRPEQARELRQKATRLAEQIQIQARRAGQRRLRQVDEHLDRLRQMVREAEEIRERIALDMEQRGRELLRPPREMPPLEALKPRARQGMENIQNIIGQIRETFMQHLDRIEERVGGLRNNMAQMEREIMELRAENERLRNQLRQRGELRRERDRDVPVERERDRPRENAEGQERPRGDRER